MKIIQFMIVFSCISACISGQDPVRIQALEESLQGKIHDTVRIRLLTEIAKEYKVSDTVLAHELLTEAHRLSVSERYAEGLGMYYQTTGEIMYYHGKYPTAIKQFERARSQYLLAGETLKMAGATVDEGNAYLSQAQYTTGLEKYEIALKIFRKYESVNGITRCLNNMGIIYYHFGDYEKALETYQTAADLYMEIGDTLSISDLYMNMGVVYVLQGAYHTALENFNRALGYAKVTDNKKHQTICMMNSGVIYNKLHDYNKALEFYLAALEVAIDIGNKRETSKCLTNIGTNYISLGRYDLAESYINRGLAIKKELGDINAIANSYNFLAEVHYYRGEFKKAIEMDNMGITLQRDLQEPEGLARGFINLSKTYRALGHLDKSYKYADSALHNSMIIGALEYITSSYYLQKELMKDAGRYKLAVDLGELHKKFSDSLMNENKARAVKEIETRYKSQALEEENEHLRIQANMDTVLIERHRKITVYVILTICMFAAALILLVTNQRRQKQYNLAVEKKNQIITRQNVKLDTYNRTKDKILSVISHDLRGTIGNQLTALSVLAKEGFKDENERRLVFSRLANSATMSLELLENLALWTNIQEGLLHYQPSEGYLNKTIHDVLELFSESVKNKDLKLFNNITGEISCYYDHFMIRAVMKNLVSNSIKFSNRGGEIQVSVEVKEDLVHVSVSDKGVGLSQGEIAMLKSGRFSALRRGTDNEKGSGLGLSIVKTLLEHHRSTLNLKSNEESGITAAFQIPCQRPV
ncbi:MAG: tetratricopeptide repeat protein [Bacteroidales bacterium]